MRHRQRLVVQESIDRSERISSCEACWPLAVPADSQYTAKTVAATGRDIGRFMPCSPYTRPEFPSAFARFMPMPTHRRCHYLRDLYAPDTTAGCFRRGSLVFVLDYKGRHRDGIGGRRSPDAAGVGSDSGRDTDHAERRALSAGRQTHPGGHFAQLRGHWDDSGSTFRCAAYPDLLELGNMRAYAAFV